MTRRLSTQERREEEERARQERIEELQHRQAALAELAKRTPYYDAIAALQVRWHLLSSALR